MQIEDFLKTVDDPSPPAGLPLALEGLWWDAKGDWDRAHQCAQAQDDRDGAWVHAYLHRKEGDEANAGYWYRRAGRPHPGVSLQEEWTGIVSALIGGA